MDKKYLSADGSDAAKALRARAEEIVHARRAADKPPPGENLLIHELRVHQAELEMQFEELRHREEELEAARAKYFGFYNLAPVGYFTIGGKGHVLEANLTSATLLGVERNSMTGRPFTDWIAAEDQDAYYLFQKKLYETGTALRCELRMKRPDGTLFWARLDGVVADDAVNGASVCHAVMADITERKKMDSVLREKCSTLDGVIESAGAPIFSLDRQYRYTSFNKAHAATMKRKFPLISADFSH